VSYQPYTQTLVVGDTDVSGVAVMLTPVKSQ
jgi:predicted methyltransferase